MGDLATPTDVTTAPLTVAAPVAAATVMSPPGIVAVGFTAMIVHAFLAAIDHTFGWHYGLVNQLTLAGVTVLAVAINRMLVRREDGLRRVRRISAVVQQAVLPTPPPRIGDLRIAARYEPTEEEGLIGGDLYAVRHSAFGTRVLIGDVRGKGLDAVRAACADVWASPFARAAPGQTLQVDRDPHHFPVLDPVFAEVAALPGFWRVLSECCRCGWDLGDLLRRICLWRDVSAGTGCRCCRYQIL